MSRPSEAVVQSSKSQRINLRASARQEDVLRRAASVSDTSLTEFILGSAVAQAEQVLADRRRFALSDTQWDEFHSLLDEPLPDTTRLRRLAARQSPFSDSGHE